MSAHQDLKEAFREAAEIAKVVPESMHGEAFNRALDEVLERAQSSRSRQAGQSRTRQRVTSRQDKPATQDEAEILRGINRTDHPEINDSAPVVDRALRVLRIAQDLGLEGLTAAKIATVLTDKFRISTSRSTVGRALDAAGAMVDRDRVSARRVVFRIMGPGEAYLDAGGAAAAKTETEAQPKPRRRSRSKSKAATKRKGETQKQTPRKTGRPGPKAAVAALIDDGYFSEPRTISDIQHRLRTKRGYAYKANELSPALARLLRDSDLDRERNDDGQFEYSAK